MEVRLAVHQHKNPRFETENAAADYVDGKYALVAVLSLERGEYKDDELLDVAYSLTNTGHRCWWENPEIECRFAGKGCRSTSMGDVIVLFEPNSGSIKTYVVAAVGFDLLA